MKDLINFGDFEKLDIRIGTIKTAEKVEDTDKLFVFKVDLGEENERQIISGVAEYFESPEDLVGKQVPVVINLEPRKIRGLESQGMILYVSDEDGLTTLEPNREVKSGSIVK